VAESTVSPVNGGTVFCLHMTTHFNTGVMRWPTMNTAHGGDDTQRELDIDVATDTTVWVEPPYRVLIHNDDKTTFDFVIRMLIQIFKLSKRHAERIAMITHVTGIALVCVRPQSEAERLVNQGIFAARLEGFPLRLSSEPEA
jgi:ATP-dependent Clp protease adaptor protein ClpS